MLWFALGSFVAAAICCFFGYAGVAGYSWDGARILSVLFLAAALGTLVGFRFRRAWWTSFPLGRIECAA